METYLAHHGILGMKWGIRRYQNADGTLTEAGKKHYADSQSMYKEESKKATKNAAKVASVGAASGLITSIASDALNRKRVESIKNSLKTHIDAHGDWEKYKTSHDKMLDEPWRGSASLSEIEARSAASDYIRNTNLSDQFANVARGAAVATSIISGVGAVAVIGSAVISAGQLAYGAYLKNQAKKAAALSGNEK